MRRAGMALAGIVVSLLSIGGAAPAFASSGTVLPPPGGSRGAPVPPAHHLAPALRTVVLGGMPGWQIALIAVAAALVAATATVLLDHARAARYRVPVTPARQP